MATVRPVLVFIFILIEKIRPQDLMADPPLIKSLGFAIQKGLEKTLEDARLNQKYMYQYHEMLKASQEAFESYASRDDRRLRRVVGDHNYVMKNGLVDRRRHAPHFQSAVGKRRVKTEALRRQKLNSQSWRSHQQHSQKNTFEYNE